MRKKLYLVKKEVYATNVKSALTAKGRVYEVALAKDEYQPPKAKIGFSKAPPVDIEPLEDF